MKFKLASSLYTALFLFFFAGALWTSKDWPWAARALPWFLAIPGLALSSWQLGSDFLWLFKKAHKEDEGTIMDISVSSDAFTPVGLQRTRKIFCWIGAFIISIWLLGLLIVSPLFVLFFLLFEAREKWWVVMLYGTAVVAFMVGFLDQVLHVPWLPGVLFTALGF